MLRKIIVFQIVLFWPLSLYLSNTSFNFFSTVMPSLLLICYYFLSKKNSSFNIVPIFFIPFIAPKLLLFGLLLMFFNFLEISHKHIQQIIVLVLAAIFLVVTFGSNFKGQTVFNSDYEAQQFMVRNTNLYSNPIVARIFHNKLKIYTDKIYGNFGALIDPNNYFFAFAPREIKIDNQNLQKFPFSFLLFFVLGFYNLVSQKITQKNSDKKFIFQSSFSALTNLSLLTVFDRADFILWFPICLVILLGVINIQSHKYARVVQISCIVLSIFELLKILTR